jgi:energy-coupling factor transporter ATP-binding protein EcfA2
MIEDILRSLSLWDKRDAQIRALSGGMKRRVLIAKALAHEPELLFLDEPTAGVDVELRKDMWQQIAALKERGVTIILTTHYIEEAERLCDRLAFIVDGKVVPHVNSHIVDLPRHAYLIKSLGSNVTRLQTPVVGAWYCGMTVWPFDDFIEGGTLAQYIGDGEFIDDEGEDADMNGYDYLAQQH